MFTTNAKVNGHNMEAFNSTETRDKCFILAIDTVGGEVTADLKRKILAQVSENISKNNGITKGGLFSDKFASRSMLEC